MILFKAPTVSSFIPVVSISRRFCNTKFNMGKKDLIKVYFENSNYKIGNETRFVLFSTKFYPIKNYWDSKKISKKNARVLKACRRLQLTSPIYFFSLNLK
jgi:hypothetical protein